MQTKLVATVAFAALSILALGCSDREGSKPTPTVTSTPTATATSVPPTVTPEPATPTHDPQPSPTHDPFPTATPSPLPTSPTAPAVEFTADAEVTSREQALVELGVLAGERYANEHFGGAVQRTVFVHIATEGVCIGGASAIGYEICVNAASRSWTGLTPEYLKLKVLAHEYFHVWQHDLFCYREPKWLFEGLAEWFAYQAMVEEGLTDRIAASTGRQVELQESPIHEPLSEQEILYAAPTRPQYALWSFAAQRLMSGRGDREVRTFCAGRREDLRWEEAFELGFGQTVQEFYKEFEEWRDAFLPWSAVE